MKTKLLSLLLVLSLVLGCVFVLAACGGNESGGGGNGEHECIDTDKDGLCDICGKKMQDSPGKKPKDPTEGGDESPYDWDTTDLIFKLTKNSNGQELPSGCERYMAGEDPSATESIDDSVRDRNAAAYEYTNTNILYSYYPDSTGYGWASNIETIYTEVMSKSADKPDMYCNFIYDMVNTSLKGSFANLRSTNRGSGSLKGENYFQFLNKNYDETVDNLGYMYEYMTTLTLSKFKMYVLGSDYFTDLVRAFFVVPVNIKLLNSVVESVTGDVNDDGECNVDDFYQMVKDGGWTYPVLSEYCSNIYQAASENQGGTSLMDEQIGFALSNYSGLSASGLLYTTSVIIIHNDWDDARDDYSYYYSETNEDLEHFCDAAKTLFDGIGVTSVSDRDYTEYTTSLVAIRERFATNHVLFGGIICVGSLEYDSYQKMKDTAGLSQEDVQNANYGFGVVPVPLYRENTKDRYLTQIHNVGRGGGISATTTKFAQCTAFLDYQSTHSTDILNEYYEYKLQYDIAGGSEGNVYMLKYIRSNVRTAFDKTFEDAIGKYFGAIDPNTSKSLWHVQLKDARYKLTNIAQIYASTYPSKANCLATLVSEYDKLPD